MHLTPSAVSQHLAALSRETRTRVVEPLGRRVRLTGAAARAAERLGVVRIDVSMTHSRELAAAVAVALGAG